MTFLWLCISHIAPRWRGPNSISSLILFTEFSTSQLFRKMAMLEMTRNDDDNDAALYRSPCMTRTHTIQSVYIYTQFVHYMVIHYIHFTHYIQYIHYIHIICIYIHTFLHMTYFVFIFLHVYETYMHTFFILRCQVILEIPILNAGWDVCCVSASSRFAWPGALTSFFPARVLWCDRDAEPNAKTQWILTNMFGPSRIFLMHLTFKTCLISFKATRLRVPQACAFWHEMIYSGFVKHDCWMFAAVV